MPTNRPSTCRSARMAPAVLDALRENLKRDTDARRDQAVATSF